MVIKKSKRVGKKNITLRDVVFHIQGVKHELSSDMQQMERRLTKRIDGVEGRLGTLEQRIDQVETNLTEQIQYLGKDIDATMLDAIKIMRHVGMHVSDEG